MEVQLKGWGYISCSIATSLLHHFLGKMNFKTDQPFWSVGHFPRCIFLLFQIQKEMLEEISNMSVCRRVKTWLLWAVGVYLTWSAHSTAHCCSHGWAAQGTSGRGGELCTLKDSSSEVLWTVTKQIQLLKKSRAGILPCKLEWVCKKGH